MKNRLQQTSAYRRAKRAYDKYERFLIPGMLLAGVVVDFVTFHSISLNSAFILLSLHFTVAALAIAFLNLHDMNRGPFAKWKYLRLAAPLLIQFTFGALLSASLIFYWFSGTLSASWPILLLVALLMISNEALRQYYQRPIVQLGVFYFILFSILTLILPYLFNTVEAWVFLLAGAISIAIFAPYSWALANSTILNKKAILTTTAVVFFTMNAMYFLNIIPPIPLSLREAGVYHSVTRVDDGYQVKGERESLIQKLFPGHTINITPGSRVYVFSSVFAPSRLNTDIVHVWEWRNPDNGNWKTQSELSFSVFGGREDGYRGYSFKSTVPEGKWRVSVETKRGQSMGRVHFTVKHISSLPILDTKLR